MQFCLYFQKGVKDENKCNDKKEIMQRQHDVIKSMVCFCSTNSVRFLIPQKMIQHYKWLIKDTSFCSDNFISGEGITDNTECTLATIRKIQISQRESRTRFETIGYLRRSFNVCIMFSLICYSHLIGIFLNFPLMDRGHKFII